MGGRKRNRRKKPRAAPTLAGSQSAGRARTMGVAEHEVDAWAGAVEGFRHYRWRVSRTKFLAGWPSFPSRTLVGRGWNLVSLPKFVMARENPKKLSPRPFPPAL